MDREVIQSTGFRNIRNADGEVTGFQFKVRLPYYRGIYYSQIRPGTLYVDGERFDRRDIMWSIGGEDYTLDELYHVNDMSWCPTKPATIKVPKKGGLAQGYHDMTYGFSFTSSYMPPSLENDEALDPDRESPVFMNEFGHHVNSRHLLIV